MQLVSVTIERFRNFVSPQTLEIEPNVTGLIGKNESGKTTILRALHRLNPANDRNNRFNLITEYPRWMLARDRRKDKQLDEFCPVSAEFALSSDDVAVLASRMDTPLPSDMTCTAARSYSGHLQLQLKAEWRKCLEPIMDDSTLSDDVKKRLSACDSWAATKEAIQEEITIARSNKASGVVRALNALKEALAQIEFLVDGDEAPEELATEIRTRLPKFFYFSSYETLPGQCNLTELANKIANEESLSSSEQTVVSLLSRAEAEPADFLGDDYDERKAELQSVGWDLSAKVFEYWNQNRDLKVIFDADTVEVRNQQNAIVRTDRILKIELRDGRHADVETNFSTRSTGFQWFFSFFAAFTDHQESAVPVVVLLDEPGLSLHGEAQKDFLDFIYKELGASQQTLYTTHSQFMVDPAKYENLRAVNDTSSVANPDGGVKVTDVSLSADRDTILPVESSLGYSVSQHLFLGSGHHLAVEGSSDFIFLQRMSEVLEEKGRKGLDRRFSIIPVGGADNLPAFVALLGRRLKVTALVDGNTTSKTMERVLRAADSNGLPEEVLVVCAAVDSALPATADIEDLFHEKDYKRIYEWGFGKGSFPDLQTTPEPILRRLKVATGEKFDHAIPAHALTDHREEFAKTVMKQTLDRFERLFVALNETLE